MSGMTSRAAGTLLAWALLAAASLPARALDQPVIWRDPDTGCGYILTPQGGATIRYQRNGRIDCPGSSEAPGAGVMENTAREMARGLDALRREFERFRDRPSERP